MLKKAVVISAIISIFAWVATVFGPTFGLGHREESLFLVLTIAMSVAAFVATASYIKQTQLEERIRRKRR